LIKNSQPFGKKFQKTVRGDFLTHTVDYPAMKLFSKYSNLCDHDASKSHTDDV